MGCFNKKVLLGLAAAAVGILVFAPKAFGAALPVLVLLACPLSMVLMMWGMAGARNRCSTDANRATAGDVSTGMNTTAATNGSAVPAPSGDEVGCLRAELEQLKAQNAALERRAGSAN